MKEKEENLKEKGENIIIIIIIFQLIPVIALLEGKKLAAYLNHWTKFQACRPEIVRNLPKLCFSDTFRTNYRNKIWIPAIIRILSLRLFQSEFFDHFNYNERWPFGYIVY